MGSKSKKPAARIGDIDTGHPPSPPTPVISASSNVFVNAKPTARMGDMLAPHHPGVRRITEGSSSVLINSRPAARVTDAINCGGKLAIGSPNVFIGDNPQLLEPTKVKLPATTFGTQRGKGISLENSATQPTAANPSQKVMMNPAHSKATTERKSRYEERKRMIARTRSIPGSAKAADRLEYNNDSILRAEAAAYVYEVDEFNRGARATLPDAPVGLNLVDPSKVPGLENAVFTDNNSGFGAALFESDINGETMLVYRGTNNAVTGLQDWKTNGLQGLGKESTQYTQAMELAKKVDAAYKGDFTSVGHSLGGGHASAGVAVTGVEGYTFNSAGLHNNTATHIGGMTNESANKLIKTQAVDGEVLTLVQENGNSAAKWLTTGLGAWAFGPTGAVAGYVLGDKLPEIPKALGEMQRLPSIKGGSPIARHGMDQVKEGIEAQKKQDLHTLNMLHIHHKGMPDFDH